MPNVPEAYYEFVMDHAPYVYVVPDVGPDTLNDEEKLRALLKKLKL